jgi:hypothetical protein
LGRCGLEWAVDVGALIATFPREQMNFSNVFRDSFGGSDKA